MHFGMELTILLELGRTLPLTARVGPDRVFVGGCDPRLPEAQAGESWRVKIVEQRRADLWRVELLERVAEETPAPVIYDKESFRTQAFPASLRQSGRGTPEHLEPALAALPELLEIAYSFQDSKGTFGIHEGIVIRPTGDHRHAHVEVHVGGVYLVTIRSAGSRGLYANTLACIKEAPCNGGNRVPDRFDALFNETDDHGLHAVLGTFKVRPHRDWPGRLIRGTRVAVRTINVIRHPYPVAFVLPADTRIR